MKRKYLFSRILWDTDGISLAELNLPLKTVIEVDDVDFSPDVDGANALSDKFEYCVFGFRYERIL